MGQFDDVLIVAKLCEHLSNEILKELSHGILSYFGHR